MKDEIVVLGAAGYIGSTVVNLLLLDGFKVHAIDNFWKGNCDSLLPFASHDNFLFSFGDVTNREEMKRLLSNADIIINLASLVGFPISKKYPALARMVSVDGMKNVLDCRPKGCPVLFSSTGSVYGEVPTGIADEETIPKPLSVYGQCKLEAEELALQNKDTIVYRFATLFGLGYCTTRTNLLLNDFVWNAAINKSLVVFQGCFRRNFVHVRDVCRFIVHTIKNYNKMYNKYRLYNVGNEDLNFSKIDLCNEISKQISFNLTLAETHTDDDFRDYNFSSKRAYEVGWKPQVNIQQGIRELIKATSIMTPWKQYN